MGNKNDFSHIRSNIFQHKAERKSQKKNVLNINFNYNTKKIYENSHTLYVLLKFHKKNI